MRLVRAELERLAARRFVQLMLVLLVAACGITAATTMAGSHRPTAAEISDAEAQAAADRRGLQRAYEDCVAAGNGDRPAEDVRAYPQDCAQLDPARSERVPVAADYLSGVFSFAQEARPLLFFLIGFLVLFGFLVGASYIGADLTSGGVVNLLIWRPRRLTVLGAKLGTLLGAMLLLSVAVSVAYLAAFWLIGQSSGLPADVDIRFWRSLGLTFLRGMVLVLFATSVGFAIATLGRRTAAALGTVAAYLVLWEVGARLVMEILDVARPDQLMLSSYFAVWLDGEIRFWDNSACRDGDGFCDPGYIMTWESGLGVLLVLTVGLTAAAFAAFRRRDLM